MNNNKQNNEILNIDVPKGDWDQTDIGQIVNGAAKGKPSSFDIAKKIHAAADDLSGGRFSKLFPVSNYHRDPKYTEVWPRVLFYEIPAHYDSWGYDESGLRWPYEDLVFSIMDDFGNAVPCEMATYTHEELRGYLSPDVKDITNPPANYTRENYPYVLHTPMPH